jgi:catechol 2,3-dioxygenase-like lactoylglutathione lyase family enzyme
VGERGFHTAEAAGSSPAPPTIVRGLFRVPEIRSISAITFATPDMARAVRFYEALGFSIAYGGETSAFTSFRVGKGHLNLARADDQSPSSGRARVIFYVDDVDAMYAHVLAQGFTPEAPPRDASWGERYFHLTDPDGNALSFARPFRDAAR